MKGKEQWRTVLDGCRGLAACFMKGDQEPDSVIIDRIRSSRNAQSLAPRLSTRCIIGEFQLQIMYENDVVPAPLQTETSSRRSPSTVTGFEVYVENLVACWIMPETRRIYELTMQLGIESLRIQQLGSIAYHNPGAAILLEVDPKQSAHTTTSEFQFIPDTIVVSGSDGGIGVLAGDPMVVSPELSKCTAQGGIQCKARVVWPRPQPPDVEYEREIATVAVRIGLDMKGWWKVLKCFELGSSGGGTILRGVGHDPSGPATGGHY